MIVAPVTSGITSYLKASYWRGETGVANALADHSGNGNFLHSDRGGTAVIDGVSGGYGVQWIASHSSGEVPQTASGFNITSANQSFLVFFRGNNTDALVTDTGEGVLFGQYDETGGTHGFHFVLNGTPNPPVFRLNWGDSSGVGRSVSSATQIPLQQDYDVVVVYDAVNDQFSLYVDGTADGTIYEYTTNASMSESSKPFHYGSKLQFTNDSSMRGLFTTARTKEFYALDVYLPPVGTAMTNKDTLAAWLHKHPHGYIPASLWEDAA